jgi:signal transduction histidine kinase
VGVFILVSAIIGYLGYSANKEIEKTVTDQFNRQQLILARKIAHDIRNHFSFLEPMLRRINYFREEREAKEPDGITAETASLFPPLRAWHVLAVVHLDRKGRAILALSEHGFTDGAGLGIDYEEYRRWGIKPESRGKILAGRTFRPEAGLFKGRWLMVMAVPTHRPATRHRGDSGYQFEGLSLMVVDPIGVAMRYAREVRSGETGYAWVIDHRGIFLSHYEPTFIGEDSFTVRQRKNPRIPYAQINEAVRKHLLKGEEGAGWYVSGWHRGVIHEMKKLFAYSPIFLSKEDDTGNLWSVAVVAPETEVYGIIRSLVIRQWLIAGAFQLIVFCCLAVAIYFSLRWSRILRAEVDERTADLRRSEAEVRQERDRVKESMQKLVEMQEKLVRSERFAAIGEAAAYLSHEIKNPLMLIGGFAGQVEKSLLDNDANREKLRIIQDETRRLELMLAEVRDFTRPARPQKELQNINSVIEDTLALMENKMMDKGIEYEKALDDRLPAVLFDPQQIKQVLINLVKNAVEAMAQGGKLVISSRREDGHIKVSVADSGPGIPPEVLKQVFNPFFTTKKKGTGLGLAVSRKVMEDHDGEIFVQSEEGKGTRITIALPIKPVNMEAR